MNHQQYLRRLSLAAALLAAAALAACGGGGSSGNAPPAQSSYSVNFSALVFSAFNQSANATPITFDTLAITDDVNDNPTAFDALLMQ